MLAADAQEVTVTGHDNHVELGPGHLDAHGHGQRPAVDAVDAIGLFALEQVYEVSAAPDSGNHHVIFDGQAGLFQPVDHGKLQRAAHTEVPAPGAPFEVIFRVLLAHARASSMCSAMISFTCVTRALTLKGKPVYCVIGVDATRWNRSMLAHCP